MRSKIALGVVLSGFTMTGLACEMPKLAIIPAAEEMDGREERIAAEAQMYFLDMEEYVECLQVELEDAGGDDAPALVRNTLIRRNNLAVAEAEIMVTLYEETFGARGDGD